MKGSSAVEMRWGSMSPSAVTYMKSGTSDHHMFMPSNSGHVDANKMHGSANSTPQMKICTTVHLFHHVVVLCIQ